MIMLKSVLSAIPTFAMGSFKLPISLCKRIQSAWTRFWWDADPDTKSVSWVAWSKLTKSKRDGGLGFREVEAFNVALLAKLSWRIITRPHSLMAKVLLSKYCTKSEFLQVEASNSASHGWRGITIGRDLLKTNLGFVLGNGKSARLWGDPWISLEKPEILMGPATEATRDWKVADLLCEGSMKWNVAKIREILPEREEEILKLKLSHCGAPDKMVWLKEKCGNYSTKSGYYQAREGTTEMNTEETQDGNFEWNKEIWRRKVSPKIQMFLWRAKRGALAVGGNLAKRKITHTTACLRCGEEETTEHVLFHCRYAKCVWNQAPFSKDVMLRPEWKIEKILEQNRAIQSLPLVGVNGETLFAWICWSLWRSRNTKQFESRNTNEKDVVTKAAAEAREWNEAHAGGRESKSQMVRTTTKENYQNRRRMTGEVTEVWTDAAWNKDTKEAGLGWIIKTTGNRNIMKFMMRQRNVLTPLMAEAQACKEALGKLRELNRSKVRIQSDSLSLIQALSNGEYPKELYGILSDIIKIKDNFETVEFTFVPRKNNIEANSVAREAFKCVYDDMIVRF